MEQIREHRSRLKEDTRRVHVTFRTSESGRRMMHAAGESEDLKISGYLRSLVLKDLAGKQIEIAELS